MSRNGPGGQAAARAPQRRQPAEHDLYGAQAPVPAQQAYQQSGGYWGQQQPYPEQTQAAYPTSGYGQPQQAYGQQLPYGDQGYGYQQPQGYHPQQPAQTPVAYGQPLQDYGQQAQDYGRPEYDYGQPEPQPRFAPQGQSQPMPYDRFPASTPQQGYAQQQPQHGWNQPQQDPRGYDFGHYMPQGQQQPGHEPPFQVNPADHFGQQQPAQGYAEGEGAYEDELLDEEEDEPRSGRRMLMIVGALVGAIGIGGAMAYTYKGIFGGGSRAPVIKTADATKAKAAQPADAGSERKMSSRLDESAAQPEQGETPEDPNAPKRVRVIPINPGTQQQGAQTASLPQQQGGATIPGIMLDMGPQMQRQPQQQQQVQQQNPAAVRVPQQQVQQQQQQIAVQPGARTGGPVRTVTVNPGLVKSDAEQPDAATASTQPAQPKKTKTAVQKSVGDDRSTASLSTGGTGGYVAVLASQKTRMDALKKFADLQQAYGDVLGSKMPDVQEANLGDKGIWYRAVVGPPGSRELAAALCSQLKAAGFNGCWVTAY